MQKPIPISIDTTNDSPFYIDKNINQGDTLAFTIKVSQGSQSLNLTGQTVRIIIKRSSGYSVEIKTGNSLLNVSNNTITAVFKDDYLCTDAAGDATGEVILIDSSGESSTNHFHFEVKKSLASDLIVKLSDKLDTLIEIQNLISSANLNTGDLQAIIDAAIQHEGILTGINNNSSSLAVRLETDIANGTPLAVRLETDIANGLTIANRVELANSNGITTENKLQVATTNGNEIVNQLKNLNWSSFQSWISLMEFITSGMPFTDENNIEFTDENNVVFTM